jgi:hypothetical protein
LLENVKEARERGEKGTEGSTQRNPGEDYRCSSSGVPLQAQSPKFKPQSNQKKKKKKKEKEKKS